MLWENACRQFSNKHLLIIYSFFLIVVVRCYSLLQGLYTKNYNVIFCTRIFNLACIKVFDPKKINLQSLRHCIAHPKNTHTQKGVKSVDFELIVHTINHSFITSFLHFCLMNLKGSKLLRNQYV